MTRLLSLTADQKLAVDDKRQRLLLSAPAGSGKTEVLARRLERILLESAEQAFRVLAVTYTVKAAEELRARIKTMVADDAWRVDCETLHSFALEWLMRYGTAVGVSPDVVVFADDTDRIALVADYLRTLGRELGDNLRTTVAPALKAIDDCRTLSPDSPVPDTWFDNLGIGLPELHDAYVGALSEAGGIDFPGMLAKLREALELDPWVLEHFHRTYRHILVDEGQDLTPAQTRLLQLLAGPNVGLFVVADDRQSINGYAGGAFANARDLVGIQAPTLSLRHNFRCASKVLQAAERVASQLQSPQEVLIAEGAPPGEVRFEEGVDPVDEANRARSWIEGLLSHGLDASLIAEGEDPRVVPEDVAVIARARWLLEPILDVLKTSGHKLSLNLDSSGFLRSSEGRTFLEALAVLVDPGDRPARRRFHDELSSVTQGGASEDPIAALASSGVPHLRDIANHLEGARVPAPDLDTLLGGLSHRFANADWRDDAVTLEQLWLGYRSSVMLQQRSIKGFLRSVARSQLAKATDPGIRILTIHRVKGLEFKAVALIGVRDGALPDYRANSHSDIESERRSLYVAMTRAQRILRISWPKVTFDRWNKPHQQQPSRFLKEAGLIGQ